ncbi:DUF3857 domain-containing protein [Aquiflexum sp.]|uniref:DUF3857 domain-containing protein n=1 Tax=Aquiflexum sp. TaxID=1872584 RepID=UPI0035941372
MRNAHLFLAILLSFFMSKSFAQNFKFGKYSPQEIELTSVDFDPDADAVVLGETSSNHFLRGFQYSAIHRRIKVLKESGKGRAVVGIRYYGSQNIQDIIKLNAQTINWENGTAKIVKLGKEDFFTVVHADGWKEVRFTFKNVQEGSILDYSYTKVNKSIRFLESWVFHNSIPTIKSSYIINIPTYLNYNFLAQGNQTIQCDFKQGDGIYKWEVSNLRSIREEPMISNYNDYLEKISFQLAGYAFANSGTYGGAVGFKESFTSWQELVQYITDSNDYSQYLKPNSSLLGQLKSFIPSQESETQKAKDIYQYVTDNFTFTGKTSFWPSKNLKAFLENKQGERQDINLTLLAYLRSNGITAYPLLISSKGNGHSNLVDSPFMDQFDQLIIYVNADSKDYFLDATNKSMPFGYLPLNFHANQGLIMREKDSGLIPLQMAHRSGIVQRVDIKFNEANNMVSESVVRFMEYDAITYLNKNLADPESMKSEILGINASKIASFEVEEKTEPRKLIETKFQILENKIDEETVFVSPFHFVRWSENPFKAEVRTFPVDFGFIFNDNYTAIIEIPEGYELDDYPEKINISIPGGNATFLYSVTILNNSVNINVSINFKNQLVSPVIYPDLKYFMEIITGKLKEPVVFKKASLP